MIYVYIIRVMKGAAGGNRPTGSMARVVLGLTIAIPAVAANLAAEEFRCHAQHWDIGRHGAAVRGVDVGFDASARIQVRCRGIATGGRRAEASAVPKRDADRGAAGSRIR